MLALHSYLLLLTLSLKSVDCFLPTPTTTIVCSTTKTSNTATLCSAANAYRDRTRIVLSSSQNENENNDTIRIRLNKVFKATHSRREADKLIASGRVSINGQSVNSKGGSYVIPHVDIVTMDGLVVEGWEDMNAVEATMNSGSGSSTSASASSNVSRRGRNDYDDDVQTNETRDVKMTKSHFQYIKYFKPTGVTCTTDSSVRGNIIESIERHGYKSPHRIYPVGRLDKDTSGIILLTSDGRLPNAVLRGINKQPKIYKVLVDLPINDSDIQRLRDGIMITTVAQRDNSSKRLTQRTKPCKVESFGPKTVKMTLMEGRNRQIRKMMGALGFTVLKLHRTNFMGISLSRGVVNRGTNNSSSSRYSYISNSSSSTSRRNDDRSTPSHGLHRPGDWSFLDEEEMKLVENALQSSSESQ